MTCQTVRTLLILVILAGFTAEPVLAKTRHRRRAHQVPPASVPHAAPGPSARPSPAPERAAGLWGVLASSLADGTRLWFQEKASAALKRPVRIASVSADLSSGLRLADVEVLDESGSRRCAFVSEVHLSLPASPVASLVGLSASVTVAGRPVKLTASLAEYRLAQDSLTMHRARVAGTGIGLRVRGTIVQVSRIPRFEGVGLDGEVDLSGLTTGFHGRGWVDMVLAGSVADASARGTFAADPVTVGHARTGLRLRHVRATVVCNRSGITLDSLSASVAGGALRGTVWIRSGHTKERTRFHVTVAGLPLGGGGKEGRQAVSGRASIELAGTRSGSGGSLAADGRLSIDDLAIDVSSTPMLVKVREKVRMAREASLLADRLLGDRIRSGIVSDAVALVRFYDGVVEELSHAHAVGHAAGPVAARQGRFRSPGVRGPRVEARFTLTSGDKQLEGSLARLQLGRVTLRNVRLSGSSSSPAVWVDHRSIELDGRRAPRSELLETFSRLGGSGGGLDGNHPLAGVLGELLGRPAPDGVDRQGEAPPLLEILRRMRTPPKDEP